VKIGGAMRIPLSIGSILLLAACAGAETRPYGDASVSGHWQGVVLRNGQRAPAALELSERDRDWAGRFSQGDNSVALQELQVTTTRVHFQAPGEGTFDGAIIGDSIAGSISGDSNGSFELKRQDTNDWQPYVFGP
jgi:hypothetical protein